MTFEYSEELTDIESRTLRCLEWDRLCQYLAQEAVSTVNRQQLPYLLPTGSIEEIRSRLAQTEEACALITHKSELLVDAVPDVRTLLKAACAGSVLSCPDLLSIRSVLLIARKTKQSLSLLSHQLFPSLAPFESRLRAGEDLRKEIERCIDESAELKDDASPDLSRLRKTWRKLHGEIKDKLNRLIHSSIVSKALQEPIFTQRNGRYVLPVDASKRNAVQGIVHDSSQSGLTVFVEPMAIVEPSNQARLIEVEIESESRRILQELSLLVGRQSDSIEKSFEILIELDAIMARARLALRYKGVRPELSLDNRIYLPNSRHPLLVLQDAEKVVANTLELSGESRTLVITGPNTGGKTVLLKQIGLAALMVKAGLLIPADSDASLPVFDSVFADIGDEQSLVQSLSTFSSHMKTIVEVVREAGAGVLVLLDEIGAGTDPREGQALARAVLEHLNASGAFCVSTTHYGELKTLAYSVAGFVNGSLAFDSVNLTPTYRLKLGVAGSSKATTIAERLGLSSNVVARARQLLEGSEKELSEMVEELETRILKSNELEHRLELERKELERTLLASRESALKESQDRELERLHFAGEIRADFTKAKDLIARLTRELQANPDQRKVTQLAKELKSLEEDLGWLRDTRDNAARTESDKSLQAGETVRVKSLNQIGVLITMPESERGLAIVRCGSMMVKVDLAELERAQSTNKSSRLDRAMKKNPLAKVSSAESVKNGSGSNERSEAMSSFIRTSSNTLDLRGQRVQAAQEMLERFIDSCVISGNSPVMIIHGHGTGAVKKAVRELLASLPASRSFRPGELYEGGDGVTVVQLD